MRAQTFLSKPHYVCLILILALAGFLYFYQLGKESLITDEYFSLYAARQPVRDILLGHKEEANPNTLPPLYEVISHCWLSIFGCGIFSQRSLSALLGILSIYVFYRLAAFLFDRSLGLLSSLFAALSFSWFYSFRINRCYSLFIFLTLLSFYVFFRYLRNKEAKYSLYKLTAVNIALIYTHYFSFLVILLQLLIGLWEGRQQRIRIKKILLMCGLVLLAYLPWFPNLIYDINKEPILSEGYNYLTVWRQLYDVVMVLFYDFHLRWNPALAVLYVPLAVTGCYKSIRYGSGDSRRNALYLILIFVIPFLAVYLSTYSNRVRYYTPFAFPLLIMLALGIQSVNRHKLRKYLLVPMILWIATFNAMDFYDFFHNPLNENWKLAAQYIKNVPDYQDKEMVFLFQTKYNPPVFAYYYWGDGVARSLTDNITNYKGYEKELSALKTRANIYLLGDMEGEEFFEKLKLFPDSAWIWIFRYHDNFFSRNFRILNKGRYFFHQLTLNKEVPQIDFYLLRRIAS